MTTRLETDLRAAFAERAAEVPAAASERLAAIDYHPRTRRLRTPAAVGVLAAGAAGTAAVAFSLVGGAANAFAGWTATPTPPGPGQIATAQLRCDGQSPVAGLPLVLSDTRGPFTFQIYADSTSNATCISGPTFTGVSGSSGTAPISVPAGQVLVSGSHMTARDGQQFSFAEGHTGAGVTGVTLVLDDGSQVQATVGGGWFVAWWPSLQQVKAADVTTASGEHTQPVDLPQMSPCSAHDCAGAAQFGVGSVGGVGGGGQRGSGTAWGAVTSTAGGQ
jgi:hypothetical protein